MDAYQCQPQSYSRILSSSPKAFVQEREAEELRSSRISSVFLQSANLVELRGTFPLRPMPS